jgi:hypothetical protein
VRTLSAAALSALLCAASTVRLGAQDSAAADLAFFEQSVRPLLVERCYSCHSSAAGKRKGNLVLDSREGLLRGGDSGPAVVPGRPEDSLLLKAIRYADADLRMPPKEKDRLSPTQVADVEAWIRRGAPTANAEWEARRKWVFEPFADPPVPAPSAGEHPIDSFLRSRRDRLGVTASGPADKRTLLRRVTFDLIGLPPTPEEIEAFVEDESPDAFARVVDRLLASPHYGERWGRHWLDLARYAVVREDSQAQKTAPSEIPEAWRYRDWVIDALNRDLPYDEFIIHQVAGDLLPSREPGGVNTEGIIASGFLAIGEWGIQDDNPEKMVWDTADENIDAVGRTFLGLTLGCARCHDHKFDPLTTRDYYALAGIFTSTHVVAQPAKIGVQTPMARIPLVTAADVDQIRYRSSEFAAKMAEAEKRLAAADAGRRGAIQAEMEELKKNSPPAIPVAVGAREGGIPETPYAGVHDARIRIRGDVLRPGDLVPRGFPAILSSGAAPITSGSGRWALARWLASPKNPLPARVLVNRLWQHHFGEGLVRTPSNFGKLGEPPTHPELLDWLAHRFIDGGWSVKAMHRLILSSAAYRLSSVPSREALEKDPDNRLLGRQNRRRLEAEPFRDALLSVAGSLDASRGGPADADPASRRRMVYLRVSRTSRSPFEAMFDGADPTAHTDRRTVSTVAPQALFLMNHPFLRELAGATAARLKSWEPRDLRARVARAYPLLYGRPATPEDVSLSLGYLNASGGTDPEAAWTEFVRVLLCANEFVTLD